MFKFRHLTLYFILAVCSSFAYFNEQIILRTIIPTEANIFTTDNLGNIYLVTKSVVEKFDVTANKLKTYSNKSLGQISSIEATNPLKIVLLYQDFSQVVYLDNMLSQSSSPVFLQSLSIPQISLVSYSYNNGLWVYNPQNFELIRLDQNLQIVQQTGNLNQLLGIPVKPSFMLEHENWLYLNDPQTGILVFDLFGTYYKTIPLKGLNKFQVEDDFIYFLNDNTLNNYNLKTLESGQRTLPDSSIIDARVQKNKLYLLKDKFFCIYDIK